MVSMSSTLERVVKFIQDDVRAGTLDIGIFRKGTLFTVAVFRDLEEQLEWAKINKSEYIVWLREIKELKGMTPRELQNKIYELLKQSGK